MTLIYNFNDIISTNSTNLLNEKQNKNKKTNNFHISTKYLRNSTYINYLTYSLFIQNVYYNKKKEVFYYFKNFCIYTKRSRSVFRSFKMCRHKLKEILDKNTISNIYV